MYIYIGKIKRPTSIENGAHGTEKLLLKTQVSEDLALWSESNNIKINLETRAKEISGIKRNWEISNSSTCAKGEMCNAL